MIKNNFRKSISLLLAIAMICSVFVTITIPTQGAGSAQPTQYSSQYNSGQRGVVCTTLDGTSASSYYTGSYVYDQLSGKSKDAIQSSLSTLMRSTHTYISSYDDCHNLADRTDCQNEDGSVSLIYTSYSATMSQWNGWNREHVWPKSLAGNTTTGGGADLHHIRPSDAVVNSTRNNNKYGNVASGAKAVYGSNPASGCLGGYYASGYFEPLDNVKGDVARICLYVYVRWGDDWGATSITKVFQSVDVLLEWMELDPVDTWEMGRNEVVQDIQGNRNVFIDYPEYAWLIFGEEVPDDYVTPSNGKGNSEGGSSTSKPTEPATTEGKTEVKTEAVSEPTPDTPVNSGNVLATFEFGENGSASHADGSEKTSYSETNNGYTLNITGGSKMYTGARDAAGNSCIKLGTSSADGLFTINVPDDVASVVIRAAKYKDNASVLSVNGETHSLTKSSDNGEYDEITIDTSTAKTVSVSTTTGGKRCMINTIEFIGAEVEYPTPEESTPEESTPKESTPEEPDDTPEEPDEQEDFYIATKRSSGNYWFMTSNLGAASTSRYTAVDSGLGTLPERIDDPTSGYVFRLEATGDGTYYIIAVDADAGSNYLGHSSGNSGTLVAKGSAVKLTMDTNNDGTVSFHYTASDAERYLSLNGSTGNNYFAFYKSGQKNALTLIPVAKPEPEPEPESPKITGYSVTLDGGTTVNVKCSITEEWLAANQCAALWFENEFGTTDLEIKAGEHAYSITLTPQAIEKKLYFVIFDGNTEKATEVGYSIYAEAAKKLEGYEGLGNLLTAIDNYTAAANSAQDMVGYTTESFTGISEWKPDTEERVDVFKDIYASLGQQISANIKINTSINYEGYTVTVTLGDQELVRNGDLTKYITSKGELVVKGLAPTHLDDDLVIAVFSNGEEVARTSFDLNSYLKRIYEDDKTSDYYKNMAAVTYQYGLAAEAYARAQGK